MKSFQKVTEHAARKTQQLHEFASFSLRENYLDYKVGNEKKDAKEIPFGPEFGFYVGPLFEDREGEDESGKLYSQDFFTGALQSLDKACPVGEQIIIKDRSAIHRTVNTDIAGALSHHKQRDRLKYHVLRAIPHREDDVVVESMETTYADEIAFIREVGIDHVASKYTPDFSGDISPLSYVSSLFAYLEQHVCK